MEDNQEQKIKKIWELPDPPPHPEMTAGALVKPDSIKPGSYLMVVCSATVKMEMTPMGPNISRVDGDPAFGGVLAVRAYCYPFIACMVLTGKYRDTRLALDVRRHKIVEVTQHFARSLMEPKQVIELEKKKKNQGKRARRAQPHLFVEKDVHALPAFMAAPPRGMADPEAMLRDALREGGWEIREPRPDDGQGQPPAYFDEMPPPVDDPEYDDYPEEEV